MAKAKAAKKARAATRSKQEKTKNGDGLTAEIRGKEPGASRAFFYVRPDVARNHCAGELR